MKPTENEYKSRLEQIRVKKHQFTTSDPQRKEVDAEYQRVLLEAITEKFKAGKQLSGREATFYLMNLLKHPELNLGRNSGYAGGDITGWTSSYGSTGFSVRDEGNGIIDWHIVVSGKKAGLGYNTWTEEDEDGERNLHSPINPESLFPRITKAFAGIFGLKTLKVEFTGAQQYWDDDVDFNVKTNTPPWLSHDNNGYFSAASANS